MSRPKTAPITPPAHPGNPLPPLLSCADVLALPPLLVLLLVLVLLYGQYVSTVLPYFFPKIPARELFVHDDGAVMVALPLELISCQP